MAGRRGLSVGALTFLSAPQRPNERAHRARVTLFTKPTSSVTGNRAIHSACALASLYRAIEERGTKAGQETRCCAAGCVRRARRKACPAYVFTTIAYRSRLLRLQRITIEVERRHIEASRLGRSEERRLATKYRRGNLAYFRRIGAVAAVVPRRDEAAARDRPALRDGIVRISVQISIAISEPLETLTARALFRAR